MFLMVFFDDQLICEINNDICKVYQFSVTFVKVFSICLSLAYGFCQQRPLEQERCAGTLM